MTLSEAAEFLGVHPTTLRRWADSGDIPFKLTPGGHRRFLRAELVAYLDPEQTPPEVQDHTGRAWENLALVETRQRLLEHPEPHWLMAFDRHHRDEKRELGRRLMGLIMQHISAPDHDDQLLIEARSIAARYAQNCVEAGLPAADGIEATAFFRDTLTEAALQLPQLADLEGEAQLRLLRKLNQVFNVVQVSFVEYYDALSNRTEK
ncbi:MAG: helix-turn-helix domain-containing protein [Chloroflexi bacterium]|nr:helix-turn-helix domain-containing protein [Chloroflexota bacterium]